MTQTVFSNDMVAHVWAQQRQHSGRSNNGNFYFEGRVLYSYGTHFPVGIFAHDGTVFLNADSYSISTSGHQRAAWSAVRHRERVSLPSLSSVQRLILSADSRGKLPRAQHKPARDYLAANWQEIPAESDGAAWLLRAIGSRGTWAAMRARLAAKADAKARRSKARMKAQAARAGRDMAARPWPDVKAEAWQGATDFGQRGLAETIKDYRESRLATPKAHKRIRSILWQRETALRAIAALARNDADRHGNPGERTKARAVIGKLRKFKAGRLGFVPGYEGPDGPDKLQAALALETGAGWRMLATLLNQLAPLVHVPPAMRSAAERLYTKADGIATRLEGEEKQRQEIRSARSAVLRNLRTFNQSRRHYRQLVESGAWAGEIERPEYPGGPSAPMNDRGRLRLLDSILSHVPQARPWGQDRGFELSPALAARADAIAARSEAIAAELEPIRAELQTASERAAEAVRKAEREQRERIARMTPAEKLAAWEAGELDSYSVRDMERERGPLLRAVAPEIDGCTVTGGTLETSQGANVPLRHAFRVFQFVALCRAERKAWKPGGAWGPRHIRVGHFSLDSVAPSGDFVAGCHSIQWPEIERLASRLGVMGCLASLPELESELAGERA